MIKFGIIDILFPVVDCLLPAGAALAFTCFFLPSTFCVPSTFSLRADPCCFVVDLIPLVDAPDLLFSSVFVSFLPAGALFDVGV